MSTVNMEAGTTMSLLAPAMGSVEISQLKTAELIGAAVGVLRTDEPHEVMEQQAEVLWKFAHLLNIEPANGGVINSTFALPRISEHLSGAFESRYIGPRNPLRQMKRDGLTPSLLAEAVQRGVILENSVKLVTHNAKRGLQIVVQQHNDTMADPDIFKQFYMRFQPIPVTTSLLMYWAVYATPPIASLTLSNC